MRLSTCFLAAAFLLFIPVAIIKSQVPEGSRNEVEVRGVLSIPSGEAFFTRNGITGSVIDFERDFDFKNEWGFEFRYTHRTASGKHKFLAAYEQTTWDRTRTLSRSFNFLGQTYVANLDASADLRLSDFRGMYAYRWGNEKFRIGPMADMGVISTRLNITGTTNNGTRTSSGKITKFAATIGYDLDYDPTPHINIYNNLGAIRFQGERLFHVEGGIRVFPSKHFGVTGGYKGARYRVEKDDDFLKVITHGPFFGGVVRF